MPLSETIETFTDQSLKKITYIEAWNQTTKYRDMKSNHPNIKTYLVLVQKQE